MEREFFIPQWYHKCSAIQVKPEGREGGGFLSQGRVGALTQLCFCIFIKHRPPGLYLACLKVPSLLRSLLYRVSEQKKKSFLSKVLNLFENWPLCHHWPLPASVPHCPPVSTQGDRFYFRKITAQTSWEQMARWHIVPFSFGWTWDTHWAWAGDPRLLLPRCAFYKPTGSSAGDLGLCLKILSVYWAQKFFLFRCNYHCPIFALSRWAE
jgi:hypothetical protein